MCRNSARQVPQKGLKKNRNIGVFLLRISEEETVSPLVRRTLKSGAISPTSFPTSLMIWFSPATEVGLADGLPIGTEVLGSGPEVGIRN